MKTNNSFEILGINIWRLGKIIFQLLWKVELSLDIIFVIRSYDMKMFPWQLQASKTHFSQF